MWCPGLRSVCECGRVVGWSLLEGLGRGGGRTRRRNQRSLSRNFYLSKRYPAPRRQTEDLSQVPLSVASDSTLVQSYCDTAPSTGLTTTAPGRSQTRSSCLSVKARGGDVVDGPSTRYFTGGKIWLPRRQPPAGASVDVLLGTRRASLLLQIPKLKN